jgi:glycosyltransferase 2 family protein
MTRGVETELPLDRNQPGGGAVPPLEGRAASVAPNGRSAESAVPSKPLGPAAETGVESVSLGSRLFRPHTIVSFAVALAIVLFFVRRLHIDPHAVWNNIRHANLALYAAACALYYGSFLARSFRWRWMLRRVGLGESDGYQLPNHRGMMQIFLLSWFVNCVVPAKLGDGYRCYLLKRSNGSPMSRSLGTIVAERLSDLIVLFVGMAAAGAIAFRGNLPQEATRTLAIGSVLIAVGIGVVLVLWFGRSHLERRMPTGIRGQFAQLHDSIFACLRRPWFPLAVSVLIWTADGLRLYLVAASLGANLSFPLAAFVSLMSALLTTLPITPAGLGVVEVAMVSVLKLADVDPSMAGSVALMDRLLTYWSLVVVGLALYINRLRAAVRQTATTSR